MVPILLVYEMLLVIGFLVAIILWLEYREFKMKRELLKNDIAFSVVSAVLARHNQILKHRCDRLRAGLRNKIEIEKLRMQMYERTIQAVRQAAAMAHAGLVGEQWNKVTMVPMRALRDIHTAIAGLQTDLAAMSPAIIELLKKQKTGKELPINEQVPREAVKQTPAEGLGEGEGTPGRPDSGSPVEAGAGNERQPVRV